MKQSKIIDTFWTYHKLVLNARPVISHISILEILQAFSPLEDGLVSAQHPIRTYEGPHLMEDEVASHVAIFCLLRALEICHVSKADHSILVFLHMISVDDAIAVAVVKESLIQSGLDIIVIYFLVEGRIQKKGKYNALGRER